MLYSIDIIIVCVAIHTTVGLIYIYMTYGRRNDIYVIQGWTDMSIYIKYTDVGLMNRYSVRFKLQFQDTTLSNYNESSSKQEQTVTSTP